MAIKWKGWTARRPVKICCVILIPVMAFIFLCGALTIARMDTGGIDEGFLFTDFRNSDYFFDTHISDALLRVQTVFGYQSEEHIRDMGCLEWRPVNEGNYPSHEGQATQIVVEDSAFSTTVRSYTVDGEEATGEFDEFSDWCELVSTEPSGRDTHWGRVRASDLESPEAKRLVEGAINNQLSEYYYAKEWLDTTGGLYYYVGNESRGLTNAPGQDAEFFREQPVHLLQEKGRTQEKSRQGNNRYINGYYGDADNTTVYIAFSKEAVDYQNAVWRGTQRQITANLALMIAPALAALVLLIILMSGAGRRHEDSESSVYFTALDKPWLDFGLAALVCYEMGISYFIAYSTTVAWRYDNIRWIVALCAVFATAFIPPLIWWILSFTKRCKAGKWWRYTLIYALLHGICARFKGFVRSLWAGAPLTARAVLITLAALMAMLITAAAPPMCLLFAAVILILLLRYSRRLHLVEQGAKAASEGSYDTPVAVNGGELGSIAASINCISGGINAAVSERMKSERLKTELITNVSHDIRTPLTSLITYTDLLKNEGFDSEKAPEYLEVLIQKSARLKTLTDDLFEASKAASGNIEVHLGILDLADFVRQSLGELDERMIASGLDFRLDLPEHAPVLADGKLLWRVMDNLLSNIFKYSLKGSRVYIDIVPDIGEYRLDVKNISEKPLNVEPSELTERFKRGDSSRTEEGSGLGLSIAQSFVKAQGGRFMLSIDGDLFKVTICLPKGEKMPKTMDQESPFA